MSFYKCNQCSDLCICKSWYKPIYCTKYGDKRANFDTVNKDRIIEEIRNSREQ